MARIIDGEKMNLVGKNVKRLRKARGMSQHELSVKLELHGVYVCRGSISRIEEQVRTVTDIELLAISKVLGVEISELYK
ncbi:MAG: helix-turn-helix transcriptional regulator [Ruminococcaceae bacterium]|nr:helix-turn-helix transcriptional regulator [Oscillospiraceae bacterium]